MCRDEMPQRDELHAPVTSNQNLFVSAPVLPGTKKVLDIIKYKKEERKDREKREKR